MNPTLFTTAWRRSGGAMCVTAIGGALALATPSALAGGTLTPINSPHQPIQILDHHVNVVINNGFAHTEVLQTFFNPNDVDLEAIYSFPIPKSASLSEVTIFSGESEINGEVLTKDEADRIYGEEKKKGNDAGLAKKNGYQTFEFFVSRVRSNEQTRLRFVYYQPLEIDTGIGRYVYPLEDGGTDDAGASFWMPNETVENTFSVDLELKSAYPVEDVRTPGFESAATIDQIDEGHFQVHVETQNAALNRDFVFYYRLADNLPGRVELISYRADADKPGTFMLVLTPGLDLQPITGGADYVFVLDTSGSMAGKIQTLALGVEKAIGQLSPDDRFRIITFSSHANELTRGWTAATPENVSHAIAKVQKLRSGGSTNLYDAIDMALRKLDDDRATSVILVTDAVTNTGVIEPKAFHELLSQYDVRFFGFLMGNNANWPLMRLLCETSGGFYAGVSNADDIIGQILLAKSKITHECLHDANLTIGGVRTFEVTDGAVGKVYRGQQLVLFGRYAEGGTATLTLDARLTGQDRTYSTTIELPEIDTENPEIERLWAMNQIEAIEMQQLAGFMPASEAKDAIESLGVEYQLVTDHTSIVVLSDEAFDDYGIDRRNRRRTEIEHQAQSRRRAQPLRNNRVDNQQPMFQHNAPRGFGNGGGAIDPITGCAALVLSGMGLAEFRRRKMRVAAEDSESCS